MDSACRFLFFFLFIKPLTFVVLGLNVRRGNLLPRTGPAILVANHNSHLDALVLLSLFPYRVASTIRPIAAADYFLRNRTLAWFSHHILRIIPVDRAQKHGGGDMLANVSAALSANEIVLVFPEGTRGRAEQMQPLRCGVAHIAKAHPEAPVTPIFVHGAGKALPKGEAILVPFFCDIFVGEALFWSEGRAAFMDALERRFHDLATEGDFAPWS